MALPRIARSVTAAAAVAALLLAAIGGCMSRRPATEPPKPRPLEPIEIDWADPGSVVEGFFDAKKRGDWKKAYSCCDFEERLGPKEAKNIRDEWKQEAPTWPATYRGTRWFIASADIRGEYALVSVVQVAYRGPGTLDAEHTGFDELCKRYGDRWKITEFEVMPE
jgi:hypothetical protein